MAKAKYEIKKIFLRELKVTDSEENDGNTLKVGYQQKPEVIDKMFKTSIRLDFENILDHMLIKLSYESKITIIIDDEEFNYEQYIDENMMLIARPMFRKASKMVSNITDDIYEMPLVVDFERIIAESNENK